MGILDIFNRRNDNRRSLNNSDMQLIAVEIKIDPSSTLGKRLFSLSDERQNQLLRIATQKAFEETLNHFGADISYDPAQDLCSFYNGLDSSGRRGAGFGFTFSVNPAKANKASSFLEKHCLSCLQKLSDNQEDIIFGQITTVGALGALSCAEELYKQDKDIEALACLDKYLQLPKLTEDSKTWLRLALDHLETLSKEKGAVKNKGDLRFDISINNSWTVLGRIIELRGECLVAILDRYKPTAELVDKAMSNALILVAIGQKNPRYLTIAAQGFGLVGLVDQAMEFLEKALMLDPNYFLARKTLELISQLEYKKDPRTKLPDGV